MQGYKNQYNVFDEENHIQPDFDKAKFKTLHGQDLGWAMLEPINLAKSHYHEIELSKRFSPGQKALYFFWYLDAQVKNGGFIQFYWNGYRKYLPAIKEGLELVGDSQVLEIVDSADIEYLGNKDKFLIQKEKDDWKPLYKSLTKFDELDQIFYRLRNAQKITYAFSLDLLHQYCVRKILIWPAKLGFSSLSSHKISS